MRRNNIKRLLQKYQPSKIESMEMGEDLKPEERLF